MCSSTRPATQFAEPLANERLATLCRRDAHDKLSMPLRSALWWLLPLVALAAMFGWETDWGRSVEKQPAVAEAIQPKPVVTALLPNTRYRAASLRAPKPSSARSSTRRAGPRRSRRRTSAPSRMKRGQFALTGTLLIEGKNTAFLRELSGNKSRPVRAGETINGLRVADVKPDRVVLALGDESEELMLKVATNPRPTPAPWSRRRSRRPPPSAAVPAAAAPARHRTLALRQRQPQRRGGQTAIERRRAARARGGSRSGSRGTPGEQPQQRTGSGWDQINQQYQQRSGARQAAPK
jgi:hypothetical protein